MEKSDFCGHQFGVQKPQQKPVSPQRASPVFEVQDLLQLAHQQHRWADLMGYARSESSPSAGIGMLLFTEAHLEYNAGLVISIGNRNKHSPLEHDTSAQTLAKSLQAGRLALVSRGGLCCTVGEAARSMLHWYGRQSKAAAFR